MNAEQTNFALLGALIAVALVLLLIVGVGGFVLLRGIGYVGRFKGLQASRKDGSLSFGGVIDETPMPAKASLWRGFRSSGETAIPTDEKGEPVPAREIN